MKRTWFPAGRMAVLAVAVLCAPVRAQSAPPARPSDVASTHAITRALYDVISGPASQPRDWDRFRSLFADSARLVFLLPAPSGQPRLYNLSVERFIRIFGPGYTSGAGYWEREIGHHADRFGTIAQVFSTYETRLQGPKSEVSGRGINGVQLIRHQNRWWITNLVFDSETESNPIPDRYLRGRDGDGGPPRHDEW